MCTQKMRWIEGRTEGRLSKTTPKGKRQWTGPPILKIELLPANDSEILNAGISRLKPPPPISPTNTFVFFRRGVGKALCCCTSLPLLSSYNPVGREYYAGPPIIFITMNGRLYVFFSPQSLNGSNWQLPFFRLWVSFNINYVGNRVSVVRFQSIGFLWRRL